MRYIAIWLMLWAVFLTVALWLNAALALGGRAISTPAQTTTAYAAPGRLPDPEMRQYATPALYVPPWAQTATLVARRAEQVDPRATRPPREMAPVPTSPWHTTIASSY